MIRHPRYWFYDIRCRLKFVLTGDCGHACGLVQPWGFVPEEGCPVHYRAAPQSTILWDSTACGECLVGEVKS